MPTAIQWTDETWSPVTGCTKVSPGCDHCYAERVTNRFKRHPFEEVQLHPDRLDQPRRWRTPKMVFVCSMGDLFHSAVPFWFIIRVFETMAIAHHHTFQVLTKRPGRMAYFAEHIKEYSSHAWTDTWPDNVWAGTSVESQKYAARLDVLARVPAKVRFVSYEPALGPVDFSSWLPLEPPLPNVTDSRTPDELAQNERDDDGWRPLGFNDMVAHQQRCIQWVIAGGESGPRARPVHPEWFRTVRDHCQKAGVPFFFKQWGEYRPVVDEPLPSRVYLVNPDGSEGRWSDDTLSPDYRVMAKVGKKAAGSLLDGVQHHAFPEVAA